MKFNEIFEADNRDLFQKVLDLVNHEATEETIRRVALARLERLAKEQGKTVKNDNGFFSVIDKGDDPSDESHFALSTGPTILYGPGGRFDRELNPEDFNEYWIKDPYYQNLVFDHSKPKIHKGRRVKFSEILKVLLPFEPLKIYFSKEPWGRAVGPHVKVTFDVENEPTVEELNSALKRNKLNKAGATAPKYHRIGKAFVAEFFISFSKYGNN